MIKVSRSHRCPDKCQQRYLPFGEVRTGLNGPRITETDFGYTGQRSLGDIGLMDYRARFYAPMPPPACGPA